MLPAKFSTVKHRNRTAMRRPSFRDDTGLVGMRYEKTEAAEPPITVASCNPVRTSSRRPSTSSATSVQSQQSRYSQTSQHSQHSQYSQYSQYSQSPQSPRSSTQSSPQNSPTRQHHQHTIVVPPPPSNRAASPTAPPAEQHPAFRKAAAVRRAPCIEPWKRDSGVARTSSTSGGSAGTATIHEEEEDCMSSDEDEGTVCDGSSCNGSSYGSSLNSRAHLSSSSVVAAGGATPATQQAAAHDVHGHAVSAAAVHHVDGKEHENSSANHNASVVSSVGCCTPEKSHPRVDAGDRGAAGATATATATAAVVAASALLGPKSVAAAGAPAPAPAPAPSGGSVPVHASTPAAAVPAPAPAFIPDSPSSTYSSSFTSSPSLGSPPSPRSSFSSPSRRFTHSLSLNLRPGARSRLGAVAGDVPQHSGLHSLSSLNSSANSSTSAFPTMPSWMRGGSRSSHSPAPTPPARTLSPEPAAVSGEGAVSGTGQPQHALYSTASPRASTSTSTSGTRPSAYAPVTAAHSGRPGASALTTALAAATAPATAPATEPASAPTRPAHEPPKGIASSPKPSRFWHRPSSASTSTTATTSSAATTTNTTSSPDHRNHHSLPFHPLQLSITSDSLLDGDDVFLSSASFSNRGSIIMLNSTDAPPRGAAAGDGAQHQQDHDSGRVTPTPTSPNSSRARPSQETTEADQISPEASSSAVPSSSVAVMSNPDIRVLAADVEKESQKVRSLYAVGGGPRAEPASRFSYCEPLEPTPEAPSESDNDPSQERLSPLAATRASGNTSSPLSEQLPTVPDEHPDDLGDWEDIENVHVDRYGFISVPSPMSRVSTPPTELKSVQYSPRRRNVLQKRDPKGMSPLSGRRTPTRKFSARSLNTQASEQLSISPSIRSSRSVVRKAANLLPHNRDRRWMDEAGDMLNATPSLQDIVDEVKAEQTTATLKRKEWERSEKWRKMAKVMRPGGQGEGMDFEFDVKNPKLVERTWKGIPDRWRAAAWWSFLEQSARVDEDSPTKEEVVARFHELQQQSSPDDVQIDLDVPRTIGRHIMFRRRYRGGQRLLFRVLHAISIYFPETGYVQGMAALAATLLCYFDEEKCFVMLVRMWQLRGLARLYQPGFESLMAALTDLNTNWLPKEVSEKLTELGIDPTAYGTRWYLTLFNMSIPFAAQLRVWDVFLLLGGNSPSESASLKKAAALTAAPSTTSDYDILHATSAALVQALKEVLIDAEFETAMKALTASIPIKDEDLLLKVMKVEWKAHHGKKKA